MASKASHQAYICLAGSYTFPRQITLLPGQHCFIKIPNPDFPSITWLVWKQGLDQGLLIGMSESAWFNLAEHSHGHIIIEDQAGLLAA